MTSNAKSSDLPLGYVQDRIVAVYCHTKPQLDHGYFFLHMFSRSLSKDNKHHRVWVQDLKYDSWIKELKNQCGFDESQHYVECKIRSGTDTETSMRVNSEVQWKSAIYAASEDHLAFYIRSQGSNTWGDPFHTPTEPTEVAEAKRRRLDYGYSN